MKVQERALRGQQEKRSIEEWDKLLETAKKEINKKGWRLRSMWESKCDTVGSETFPSLVCVAWLCSLPGMYSIQPRGGQWISLNDTKARELRLGMKPLAQPPAARNQEQQRRKKQLWSALSFSPLSVFLRLFSVLTPFPCTLHHKALSLLPSASRQALFMKHDIAT